MYLAPMMHFTLHAPSAGSHIVAHLKVIEKDKHAIKNFGARPPPAPAESPGTWGAKRSPMVHHACPEVPGLGPGLPCTACAMLCTGHGVLVQMPELCRDAWHCHAHGST